uniref:Uncharacterized protein n=1 Tax=Streptomyces pratensis (strain ATCC 33331 / IAF-45CD) TaxID=591167 RepID=A0A8D3WMW2_STRFA
MTRPSGQTPDRSLTDGRTDDPAPSPGASRRAGRPSGALERFYGPGARLSAKTADRAVFAVFPGQDRHPAPHPHRHPARFDRNAPPPHDGRVAVGMTVQTGQGGGGHDGQNGRGWRSSHQRAHVWLWVRYRSGGGPGESGAAAGPCQEIPEAVRTATGPTARHRPDPPGTPCRASQPARIHPPPPRPDIRWRPAERPLAVRWEPSSNRWLDGSQTGASGPPADRQRTPSGPSSGFARLTPRHPKVLSGSPDDVDEAAGLPVR